MHTTPSKHATPSEKWLTSAIGFILFQYPFVLPSLHVFQKICLCKQSSIAALIWKVEGFGLDWIGLDWTELDFK